ncbi:MAG: IPT/TIG domain-containing protein [Bradymonadia bacterium]
MWRTLSISAAMIFATLGCGDDWVDPEAGARPVLREARPEMALPGGQITILGLRFGLQGTDDGLWLGGAPVTVLSWSDDELLIEVPEAAGFGQRDLVMRSGQWVSAPLTLTILAPPTGPIITED